MGPLQKIVPRLNSNIVILACLPLHAPLDTRGVNLDPPTWLQILNESRYFQLSAIRTVHGGRSPDQRRAAFKKLGFRFPALWFVLVPPTSVKNNGGRRTTNGRTAGNNFVAIPSRSHLPCRAATGAAAARRSRKMTNFDRLPAPPATIFQDNSEIGGLDSFPPGPPSLTLDGIGTWRASKYTQYAV